MTIWAEDLDLNKKKNEKKKDSFLDKRNEVFFLFWDESD